VSDFSTVKLANDLAVMPPGARVPFDRTYQTKDLPDDEELSCCVNGLVESDGCFVRDDTRGRFWNPNFAWWVRLVPRFGGDELYAHFVSGRVVKIQFDDEEYRRQRPDGIDCPWVRID